MEYDKRSLRRGLLLLCLATVGFVSVLTLGLVVAWQRGPLLLGWWVAAVAISAIIIMIIGEKISNRRKQQELQQVIDEMAKRRQGHDDMPIEGDFGDQLAKLVAEFNSLHKHLKNAQLDILQADMTVEKRLDHHTKDLRKTVRVLEKASQTDSLTGIANRRHLSASFTEFFNRAKKENCDLACMIIDIDHLKAVNDTFGHSAGDNLIQFVGRLLHASIREHDFCGRYGGDEFVVLLWDCSAKKAIALAERIRKLYVREVSLAVPESAALLGKNSSGVGMSIGLATKNRDLPSDDKDLLRLADEALYKAKQTGKNRVVSN